MTRSPRVSAVGALLAALVLTVAVAGSPSAAAGEPALAPDWRIRMLAYVNALRADAGVAPVRLCPALSRSAERYARTMAGTGTVDHVGPNGSTAGERMAAAGYRASVTGETLAGGQDTVVQVMRAWRALRSNTSTSSASSIWRTR